MSNESDHGAPARKKRSRVPVPDTRWPTRAEAAKSLLVSPLRVGAFTTRTRSWVPAMVPWRSTDEGYVTKQVLDWYGRFADGRPGVLVVEATGIRDIPSGPLLRIGHDRFLPGLRRLVDTVREHSEGQTRFLIQIIDFLAIRRRPPREKYLLRFLELRDHHRAGLARIPGYEDVADHGQDEDVRAALLEIPHEELLGILSARETEDLEYGYRERVNDLHLPHVRGLPRTLPGLFAEAAARARKAGFDGAELHYAHAYTMASFLSRTNMRDDGYGGSMEHRVRLPLEVLAAVRAKVHNAALLKVYKGKGTWVRKRSNENVIAEIERARESFPTIEAVNIVDDLFFLRSEADIDDFARQYQERVNLPLELDAFPNTITEQKVASLSRVPISLISMGIQSGSADTLKRLYARPTSLEKIVEGINIFHDRRIRAEYHYIVSNPYEPDANLIETMRFAATHHKGPAIVRVFPLMFYPGTPLYDRAREDGLIGQRDEYAYSYMYTGKLQFGKLDYLDISSRYTMGNLTSIKT